MKQYEVGDTVTIRNDLIKSAVYGKVNVHTKMCDYKGKVARIKSVNLEESNQEEDPYYKIDLDSERFCWSSEMFEEVKSDKISEKITIKILGTKYTILDNVSEEEDPILENMNGYVDKTTKTIVIGKLFEVEDSVKNPDDFIKKVKRHEILHAYLLESGLDGNTFGVTSWADNEEMVDWFAIQSPKIYKTYKELNIL